MAGQGFRNTGQIFAITGEVAPKHLERTAAAMNWIRGRPKIKKIILPAGFPGGQVSPALFSLLKTWIRQKIYPKNFRRGRRLGLNPGSRWQGGCAFLIGENHPLVIHREGFAVDGASVAAGTLPLHI